MNSNCRTRLARRRRCGDPMAEYDRLPPAARRWLSQAVLPWSARSVRRLWRKALQEAGGDERAALNRLSRAEAARLAREGGALSRPLQQGQSA
ncbi:DUF6525 family protein [uncultured Roseovarius sp.]|uniref:DUF6525 family protein n=1 Tax=uncultured Roseovarius sp. TaxID=293344 RepID=UPI0025D0C2E1|nr:DUF6525 family protein [uncultured Roseovarius sp.]